LTPFGPSDTMRLVVTHLEDALTELFVSQMTSRSSSSLVPFGGEGERASRSEVARTTGVLGGDGDAPSSLTLWGQQLILETRNGNE